MKSRTAPLLAVLFDADNISPKYAQPILEEVATFGEAAVRRFYGDVSKSQLSGWNDVARELGLVPQHQPAHTNGKNSTDIAMVIDAMDMMHSGRFDGFVLVTSDKDFIRCHQPHSGTGVGCNRDWQRRYIKRIY